MLDSELALLAAEVQKNKASLCLQNDAFDALGLTESDFAVSEAFSINAHELSDAVSALQGGSVTSEASIGFKLRVALYTLSAHTDDLQSIIEAVGPDWVARGQALLNSVLLGNPILMHPAIQCTVVTNALGLTSAAHAVCVSARGRFPMLGDAGVSKTRLQRWARSPVVTVGLQARPRLYARTLAAHVNKTPFQAACETHKTRTSLIASLEGLRRMQARQPNNNPFLTPFNSPFGTLRGAAHLVATESVVEALFEDVQDKGAFFEAMIEGGYVTTPNFISDVCKLGFERALAAPAFAGDGTAAVFAAISDFIDAAAKARLLPDAANVAQRLADPQLIAGSNARDVRRIAGFVSALRRHGVVFNQELLDAADAPRHGFKRLSALDMMPAWQEAMSTADAAAMHQIIGSAPAVAAPARAHRLPI